LSGTGGSLPGGVSAGHWTDPVGRTGCTVVLAPDGAMAGVDVRGGAPGTIGTDGLRPGRLVELAHAILLTGGSAFGLDAAGGVMLYLEEHGVGHPIGAVRVPIVAGAVIFDLLTGDPRARPDAAAGYAACEAATGSPAVGAVGAGTGATVAKAGGGPPRPGGLGIASQAVGLATVAAVMVANAVGAIWDDERHDWVAPLAPGEGAPGPVAGANTTIGVVVTDA
jgi:L-aminopeptidase/D-esterase-like protein